MLIDSHCHLVNEDYDIDEVIERAKKAGIQYLIVSGSEKEDNKLNMELLGKYNNVFLSVGYHPSMASSVTEEDYNFLEKCLMNDKVVAIGEIGLDYHYGKEDIEEQKSLFRRQMDIAKKNNLPAVIHSRDATADTIEILSEYPEVKCDIHCFSGSLETARIYISMGYKLGIGGVVTFKNSNLYKVIEAIGCENILLETDAPYLTPVPFRGKKNSSKYIKFIAKRISEILDISEEEVSKITLSNTYSLFDLK